MTNQTIHDDQYIEIDDEFEQIRTSLGMYISQEGTDGAMHLLKEATNNDIDEAVNPEALCREFDIIFDEREQSISTVDQSRGIPFDKMIGVCTKKHTSTKFHRDTEKMKEQCGRNGVGLVVIAACSSYMSMVSSRGNQEKMIEFVDGKLTEYDPVKLKKPRTGLAVKFIPSPKYLRGEIHIEPYMVEDYLRHMSYIIREDVTFNLYVFTNDMPDKDYKEKKPTTSIHYKRQGLCENVKYLSSTLEFAPIEVSAVTENFDLELAFSYDKTIDDTVVDSYCNYVHTIDGGNHEIVAQRAICDFFSREAKKLDPNNKYEVTFDDCRKGLIYCINCKHIDPAYEGQHKSKVTNKDVLAFGKKELTTALRQYFGNNNALLRRIISYLRTISKVRMEAHKIKGITQKKQTTFVDDDMIKMWHPLAVRNHRGYSEIILGEGDSATNAIDNVRNSMFQAVLGVQGVVTNTYGLDIAKVLQVSSVFRNFVTLLGCGFGKDFDITKLKYDKIIIMTDADIDGSNITSLILVFIGTFLPELIIQGKVYKALPPLMQLDDKTVKKWKRKTPYLFSKEEYYQVGVDLIVNNIEIALQKGDSDEVIPLSKKEEREWLMKNSQYTFELGQLEKRSSGDLSINEYLCYAKSRTTSEDEFKRMVDDHYNELTYNIETKTLEGSYQQDEWVTLIVDEVFWRAAKRFMKCISLNESLYLYAKNRNNPHDTFDRYTISEFLLMTESAYQLKLLERFKGLGEAGEKALFETALNPKTRKLIRFTMNDVDEAKKVFDLLHAKTSAAREQRRILLKESSISYRELDN